MTNADKIRGMTDEELASLLGGQCACCIYRIECTGRQHVGCECEDEILAWLKKEVQEWVE